MIKPTEGKDQKEIDPQKLLHDDPCHKQFHHLDSKRLMDFIVKQEPSIMMLRLLRYANFLMDKSGGDLNRWHFHSTRTLTKLQDLRLRTSYLKLEQQWIDDGWISRKDQQKSSGADATSLRRLGPRFASFRRCDHFDVVMQMYAELDKRFREAPSSASLHHGGDSLHEGDRGSLHGGDRGSRLAGDREGLHAGDSNPMISNPMNFKGVRTTATASAASGASMRASGDESKSAGTDQNATISPGVEAMLREAELLGLALNAAMLQATVDFCIQSLSAPIALIREQWPLCAIHISQVNSPDPYQVFRNWLDREIKRRKQADRNRNRSNRRSARNGVDLHERIASSSEPVNQVDQLKLIDEL